MEIITRFAQEDDLPLYTKLLQKTYESAYVNEALGLTKECFSPEIFANENTQEYLRSHLLNLKTQKTWFTFVDEKLVGSITCILKNEREAELTGFYVHPQFQKKGIGKKLYNQALTFAEKRNLFLDIYCHNTQTIALYEKWGWELDTTKGENGFFYRHWPEWPEGLQAKCQYMRRKYF